MRISRGFPLVRAALASAIAGHWLANGLADPDEYALVGLTYEGFALVPILIQTALVAALIVAATIWRPARWSTFRPSRAALAAMLAASQLGLSWLLEATERLSLGSTYAGAFSGGWLQSGFGLELVIAVASAALLVILALGLRTLVKVLLAQRRPAPRPQRAPRPWIESVRPVRYLDGSGAVRAPPSP